MEKQKQIYNGNWFFLLGRDIIFLNRYKLEESMWS